MAGSMILLHLAGAVALLLWATRMVRSGFERLIGPRERSAIREALKNRLTAAASGLFLAVLFQSATAVALLVTGFAGQGVVGVPAGISALLGADLGSAIAARLLSFDLEPLVPMLLLAGTIVAMISEDRPWRQAGRILIGLGLLLLSLRLIGEASEPMRESRLLPVIVSTLSGDAPTAFIVAAIITWLFHSSVAAILLIAALAGRGLIPPQLGLVLMLGANFGGALIGAALTRSGDAAQRAIPLGNLMLRGAGAIAAAIALSYLPLPLDRLGGMPASRVLNGHIAFNTALLIAGLVFVPLVARLAASFAKLGMPAAGGGLADAESATALDEASLGHPARAIGNATREVLRMCESIDLMLDRVLPMFRSETMGDLAALAALDDKVDSRHSAIKLYLARTTAGDVTESQALRCQELADACVKIEQVGDIIVRNMIVHIQKMRSRGIAFTPDGWDELTSLHAAVLANARLTFNVIVSRDEETARQIVEEKDRMREREKQASLRHFERLRAGDPRSVESSSIHLDTIRDLKEINSLLASLAYPVLEEAGLLSLSRLKKD